MSSNSLFPAYSKDSSSGSQNVSKEDVSEEWLQNRSFAPDLIAKNSVAEEESFEDSHIEDDDVVYLKDDTKHKRRGGKSKKHETAKRKLVIQERPVSPVVEEKYSIQGHLKKLVFVEDTGLSSERAYRVDLSCDHDNFALGCLDRKHIAKYIAKNNFPLGVPVCEFLLWSKETKKKKEKLTPRYFSGIFKIDSKSNEHLYAVQSEPSHALTDYVPLSLKSNKASLKDVSSLKSFDGISMEWKTHNFSASSESRCPDSATENQCFVSPAEQEINERTTMLNKLLKEDSGNEQLWIDFVSFQDEVFRVLSCYKNVRTLEHHVIEKKLAILDRAVEQNPNSLRLLTAKLELCKGFWETDKLLTSWEELLFLHPNNVLVWNRYLMFVLSNFTYFTIPRIIKLYSKCLKTLKSIYEGHFQSHAATPNILEDTLDIFCQLCFILREGGYNERALATFQALLEFNLFTPSPDRSLSCDELVLLFESFWDSGVPRFGEDNAVGWSAAVSRKQMYTNTLINSQDLNASEDDILSQKSPLWKTWLEFENLRKSHCWLPWRPNPELDQTIEDCEDQDRIVLFEDVAPVLFILPSEEMKFKLLCKFLLFLGVELHSEDCSFFSERGKNSQLTFGSFDALSELLNSVIPDNNTMNVLKLPIFNNCKDLSIFISNVFLQAKTAFSSKYFNVLSLAQLKHMIRNTREDPDESTQRQGLKYLKKYAKSLLKETSSRNCLFLWTEYIFIEWISSNKTASEDTFECLLIASTSSGADEEQYRALAHFVTFCIKLFMGMKTNMIPKSSFGESDKIAKFSWVLAHVSSRENYVKWQNSQNLRPTLILKAVSNLRDAIDNECSLVNNCNTEMCRCLNPHSFLIISFFECLLYLQYFTHGAASALHVFNETMECLSAKLKNVPHVAVRHQIEQQLYVSYGLLLNFHTWNTASPLTTLRTFLFEAVEKFPSNVCLLHLLSSVKSASAVVGQIRRWRHISVASQGLHETLIDHTTRHVAKLKIGHADLKALLVCAICGPISTRFFYKLVNNSSDLSPVTWLFSIASELAICHSIQEPVTGSSSPTFVCGLTWKIRSLFEKALQSPDSQHCVALWRAYCRFEVILGEPVKAKKIYHQALQHCAWSKALYMDAVQYFPEDFVYILNVMSEKQLRVHTPHEEVSLLIDHFAKEME